MVTFLPFHNWSPFIGNRAVGDKAKWFAHELLPVRFSAFAPPCDPGGCDKWNMPGLASVLRGLREHHLAAEQEPATDESGSDSEAISTSSSCSSLRCSFNSLDAGGFEH